MSTTTTLTQTERKEAFREINEKSDAIIKFTLWGYFAFGFFLAFFYDTYFIALVSGGLCLAAYFLTKAILPDSGWHRYLASVLVGVFSAQYIYQMHGLFEMHFFFFVGATLLITYQNWRLQIPLLLFVVIHHASFAYLQYSGMKEIYFTQLDYMDLQAFLFHAGIAGVIIFISGYWAFDLEGRTMREFKAVNTLAKQLTNVKSNIAFAEEISRGNLRTQLEVSDEDELGRSLLRMRKNLVEANEREQAEKYITTGLAKIGEILRGNSSDIKTLADELISFLVKYLQANQGTLFILEEEEDSQHLKMMSCYAFNRKKFVEQKIEVGQGLIGQCFLERDIIKLTNVPENYIRITSGLGEANPRCVVLVPLVSNDQVYGVLELASFKEIKEAELEFLRKASESVASSIISTRTTEKIKTLLNDSQQRSEELRAQEEEMRQNMEEMQATQEEMARKNFEIEQSAIESNSILSGINEVLLTLNLSPEGKVLDANDNFLKRGGFTQTQLKGNSIKRFLADESLSLVEKIMEGIDEKHTVNGKFVFQNESGDRFGVNGVFKPIINAQGRVSRMMLFATEENGVLV